MDFFRKLFLGNGTLKPETRTQLEAEGLVALEEGVPGTIRYSRFRAPGRRHHGKVVGENLGIGLSEERLVVYCRSGRAELVDSRLDSPKLAAVDVSVEGNDTLVLHIDYARMPEAAEAGVSGEIKISARTAAAAVLAQELEARLPRAARNPRAG